MPVTRRRLWPWFGPRFRVHSRTRIKGPGAAVIASIDVTDHSMGRVARVRDHGVFAAKLGAISAGPGARAAQHARDRRAEADEFWAGRGGRAGGDGGCDPPAEQGQADRFAASLAALRLVPSEARSGPIHISHSETRIWQAIAKPMKAPPTSTTYANAGS